MSSKQVSHISDFLGEFRGFSAQQESRIVDTFTDVFNKMKIEFAEITDHARQEALVDAPSFNVFKVLGLSRYENRTHSAMLAHLLDPSGSHGQQFLFLEGFLSLCHDLDPTFPVPSGVIKEAKWEAYTELTMGRGRMDIVLRSPDLNYLVVIENKIDAGEQENQLLRYSKWLDSQENEYKTRALIFLTPLGDPAISDKGVPYFRVSYRQDIFTWLKRSKDSIQAKKVKEVVQQYIDLIERI